MKRMLALLLILCTVFGLAGCVGEAEEPAGNATAPSTTPTTPAESTAPTETTPPETTPPGPTTFKTEGPFDKNVPEFMALLAVQRPDDLTGAYAVQEKYCCNFTPQEVAAETNMQIFRDRRSGKSYILLDDQTNDSDSPEIFRIPGDFVSATPWDYDSDGVKDLLITYNFGSGNLYRIVGIFNSVSKEFTRLYQTLKLHHTIRLFVTQSASDVLFDGKTEADGQLSYPVFEVEDISEEILDGDTVVLTSREFKVTGIHGHIEIKDGKPEFIPYGEQKSEDIH